MNEPRITVAPGCDVQGAMKPALREWYKAHGLSRPAAVVLGGDLFDQLESDTPAVNRFCEKDALGRTLIISRETNIGLLFSPLMVRSDEPGWWFQVSGEETVRDYFGIPREAA